MTSEKTECSQVACRDRCRVWNPFLNITGPGVRGGELYFLGGPTQRTVKCVRLSEHPDVNTHPVRSGRGLPLLFYPHWRTDNA